MPRFQRLTIEELNELKNEFVEFLSVQGITAAEWTEMKSNQPAQADHMIDQFSDMVYGSVMLKIRYLEYRGPQHLHVFHCADEHLVLIAMESADEDSDFTDPEFFKRAVTKPPGDLKVYTSQKKYDGNREDEIFAMLLAGCTTSDGQLYELLKAHI